jgi:polyhydroxyalkanoate synthesis regulator phasin
MKSNTRFHSTKENRQFLLRCFLTLGITLIAGMLAVQMCSPVHGFHKETALLKKYSSLEELVHDIKNGKVNFEDFRTSDGIALTVMKDSKIYDKMDNNTKNCIDFAGKLGNNLGDSEIVHCFGDASYFKNKYQSSKGSQVNSVSSLQSSAIGTINDATHDTSNSQITTVSSHDNSWEKKLINELVKTGKFTKAEASEFAIKHELLKTGFTQDQASEFANKIMQGNRQLNTAPDNKDVSRKIAIVESDSEKSDHSSSNDNRNTNQSSKSIGDKPEDYNDLGQLVEDIKDGHLDADRISLNDFQHSKAYQGLTEQTQDCIDLAGKIGHNLDDSEIVHCSEDANYFKNKDSG